MSNIPNFEQWGKMNDYLNSIAVSLGADVDVSTWEGVRKAVRLGLAPDLFPIGTQLKVNHSVYGERLYDVVAHDYFKSAKNENAHTMTILCHDSIALLQFDAQEAFYYAENELKVGTYNFTIEVASNAWAPGTYQFTLTKALPKGGQLCIGGTSSEELTALTVRAYSDKTVTTATEDCIITIGKGGTSLGTLGVELNHVDRVATGSNNYKESAIRQFLNSSAIAGEVWTPQTKFDRPPLWGTSLAGFTNGLDSDFLDVVGEVIVPCSANDTYESPDSTTTKGTKYTVTDKFYFASQNEILGLFTNAVEDGSVLFPYYKGATNIDRIKYRDTTKSRWWLRSSDRRFSHATRVINSDGNLDGGGSCYDYDCVPACTII